MNFLQKRDIDTFKKRIEDEIYRPETFHTEMSIIVNGLKLELDQLQFNAALSRLNVMIEKISNNS